jgi:hypothetical protein
VGVRIVPTREGLRVPSCEKLDDSVTGNHQTPYHKSQPVSSQSQHCLIEKDFGIWEWC